MFREAGGTMIDEQDNSIILIFSQVILDKCGTLKKRYLAVVTEGEWKHERCTTKETNRPGIDGDAC